MAKTVNRSILEQIIAATSEPLLLVRVDQPNWPVVMVNPAFASITENDVLDQPFADVIEALAGRELALEASEAVRAQEETSMPVEAGGREYLLAMKPLQGAKTQSVTYYAVYWRSGSTAGSAAGVESHNALLKAKRRIRDLSRDDPVTGLLNSQAFTDVFEHDWAVAEREDGKLSLVVFSLDDFSAYQEVFGRHASDSCMRRVGQAIRRCLRRASDVVARPGGDQFIVLSHASAEDGVRDFAAKISEAVRELGLHHPRSRASRFVTVSFAVTVADIGSEKRDAKQFLEDLLKLEAE